MAAYSLVISNVCSYTEIWNAYVFKHSEVGLKHDIVDRVAAYSCNSLVRYYVLIVNS